MQRRNSVECARKDHFAVAPALLAHAPFAMKKTSPGDPKLKDQSRELAGW